MANPHSDDRSFKSIVPKFLASCRPQPKGTLKNDHTQTTNSFKSPCTVLNSTTNSLSELPSDEKVMTRKVLDPVEDTKGHSNVATYIWLGQKALEAVIATQIIRKSPAPSSDRDIENSFQNAMKGFQYEMCCHSLGLPEKSLVPPNANNRKLVLCYIGHTNLHGSECQISKLNDKLGEYVGAQLNEHPEFHADKYPPIILDESKSISSSSSGPELESHRSNGTEFIKTPVESDPMGDPKLDDVPYSYTSKLKELGDCYQEVRIVYRETIDPHPPHLFITTVTFGDGLQARGESSKKKDAKHQASKALWELLADKYPGLIK